ncbi:putative glutamine synthetase [Helianthus annuus]|nr:glutamine synthetase, chloroplastic [Helianthus annuus]KAF5776703.1 putative glutamine synthetase [Helianthus annuus]KAJ0488369.1 putative glutamine synthetase [Helianthus annuus]KAJ0491855.1 putative glutamine synthetase [Helianthus annuus]KAJ0504212.1 putative glutamine synthetase [Helianthus annuus]KAJ0673917.1 putative glutamine synthetase [Helianthus annuus]
MAQCLAPSVQWQMRLTKNAMEPSCMSSKMFNSFSLKPSKKGAIKTATKFRICASASGTINRMEDLLNLDVTPYTDKIIAEYIWIGGSGTDVRSKSRTLSKPVEHPSELPKWNYDGSSTGQAPGEDSEVILYPQAIFRDPFRGGNNILVICDAYTPQGEPIPTNKRAKAAEIFSDPKVVQQVPWFGIEQEYTLLQPDVKWPLGWPVGGYPGPQGPYYCGAGADKSFGRDISDAHYKACLYAGINISGTNGEVMPGQWEFQVGPSVGIEAGDHIWCARYLLERITEQAGVVLTLDPKPIEGDWNGAGCHTNYSTKAMREDGGFEVIKKAILNLSLRHTEHISAYGEGNERRLTGKHETASINQFSWGVANRGCSIRVGRDTEKAGKGYLEDRRPASNMDPYTVTGLLAETTILWEPTLEAEALAAQKLALNV